MRALLDIDKWAEMRLRGLILDPNSDSPVIVLREEGSSIFLPIWIGVFEANAIALALEGVQPRRPMTHDLLRATLETLGGQLQRVEIHSLIEGTFVARLIVQQEGAAYSIDSRPSDAIALALRSRVPIWAARTVLDEAVSSAKAVTTHDDKRLLEWLKNAQEEDLGKYSM